MPSMFIDLVILFIVLTVLFLFISIYETENNPFIAIPFIMLGMIFTILVTYGLWDVEIPYVGYNSTFGNSSFAMFSTSSYVDPSSYIFILVFFVFVMLFIRCGWNLWSDALETKGEMDYSLRSRRR